MLVDFEGSFASFRWTDFVFFDVRHPTTGAHSMQLDKSVFLMALFLMTALHHRS